MIDPRRIAASDRGPGLSLPRLLFAVLGAPVLWALHLSVVYFLVTLHCISAWNGGGWSVAAATALFGAGSAWSGWTAWSTYRRLDGDDPAAGEREWARFLLLLGVGASVIFTTTIVLEGLSPLFAESCG